MPHIPPRDVLAASLEASGLAQGAAAAMAIRNGWSIGECFGGMNCAELLHIYSWRMAHLATKTGEHAASLRASTSEFVRALQSGRWESGAWLLVRGNAEHEFLVFLAGDSYEPIGCMRTVSKPTVSPG